MKFAKDKTATGISLFLIFAIAISLVALPAVPFANAQGTVVTYAFVGAMPNPVGVGQEVLIHTGITQQLSSTEYGYKGLTVTVTRPDGTSETLGPFTTDATGGTGTVYVPNMEGTYKLQTNFPEQKYPATLPGRIEEGTVMQASKSEILELVVQAEAIPIYPGYPLPTEYWTRPIDAQIREWSAISGNWLEAWPYVPWDPTMRVAPYNDGPETGHIIWAKTLIAMGGIAGGEVGDHGFESGDAYEGKFLPPIIIGGVLFYNQFQSGGGTNVEQIVVAVELRTGEELWARPLIDPDGFSRRLEFGQVFYWDSFNYHGVFGYLWAISGGFGQPTAWHAFDPSTGRWVYSMENVPSGERVRGPKGEIYIYTVNQQQRWMTLWNSSRVVTLGLTGPSAGSWLWGREGTTFDAARGIEWNVTIPEGLPIGGGGGVRASFFEDRILISSDLRWDQTPVDSLHLACINTKPGREGELLFNVTWTPPQPPKSAVVKVASAEDGVFIIGIKETRQFVGMSLDSGKQLWIGDPMHYLEIYSATNDRRCVAQFYDGKFFGGGMGGIVYCHDAKNGTLLWKYEAYDAYNENLWGNNWPVYGSFVADGKLYVHTCEHSPIDPKPRGHPFICLDTETGEEIWSINLRGHHWGGYPVIGDSTIAIYNTYDQRIYALGKGPSETTVSIKDNVVPLGSSVLLDGMVMDISPGTEDVALRLRFPKGVPAVADADISEWMEYVYLQHNRPEDAVGVEVVVEVLDPNNNFYEVGRTTSDSDGFYSVAFSPEVPGKYTVIASFKGSKAYYGSHAKTAINVEQAPQPTPAPTPIPASAADLYFLPVSTGIIIAIVIVLALLILVLRKR